MTRAALAIVGAGPAGIAAAVEATRLGKRPVLLDATGLAGGTIRMAHEVRDVPFLEDRVTGEIVADQLAGFLRRWDIAVRRSQVRKVATVGEGVVLTTSSGELLADAVILALGTEAVIPVVAGLEGQQGVWLFGSAIDACRAAVPSRAVVIGGSDVAMDQARWLRARGSDVEVLARGGLRAPGWLVEAALHEGVKVSTETRVKRARSHDDGCELEIVNDGVGATEFVQAIVAAIGRRPVRVEGLDEVIEREPKRIRVVGDGTGRRARHVVAALGDGCIAAAELLARSAGGTR